MDYLILKVTPDRMLNALQTRKPLEKIMSDNWRITPKKTRNVEKALVLYNGVILGEFYVSHERSINIDTNTLNFTLKPIKNSNLVNKMMNYKTSNPASVMSDDKLHTLIITDSDIGGNN